MRPILVSRNLRLRSARACRALLAFYVLCAPAALRALPPEDLAFADYLIKQLRYWDTAARWLDSLERGRTLDAASQAEIAGLRIDILKAQGKEKEALQALEEYKKRFPHSPRASMGTLEVIGVELSKATKLLEQAVVQPKEKAAESVAAAEKLFNEEVIPPLDAFIADFQGKYGELRKQLKADDPQLQEASRVLQHTELARVNIYLLYAQKLPQDHERRKALLEKGAELAAKFVNDRYEFPVMQFRAQLQLGIYAYELGQFAKAEETLDILYNAEPPLQRPFAQIVVDAFKSYRVQAILFGARSAIARGAYARALKDVIERYYFKSKNDELSLARAEDQPDLRAVATLVRLEYGVALCGTGQAARGLAEIHAVIDKPNQAASLVTDGRKALGRVASLGFVRLSGADYYQAALGLKSELKWDAALYTFQTALLRLDAQNEDERNRFAPLCLNEIGEIYYLKGQYIESALAYEEACRHFASTEHEILAKVSQNLMAAVTKAIQLREDGLNHAGLTKLRDAAAKYSDMLGGDIALIQSLMVEGRLLLDQGQFREAREKFLQVPHVYKGTKIKFYWQAQAGARECICREWDQADSDEKQKLQPEVVKAVEELKDVVPKAIEDDDKVGAGKAAFFRGQVLYQLGRFDEAAETLAVFTTALTDEKVYRSVGLAVLCLAEVKRGDCDAAARHFEEIWRENPDLPVLANLAAALADCYDDAGNAPRSAEFALFQALHLAAAADMEQPALLGLLVRRLIDGGKLSEAKKYMEKLRATGREDDPALSRQLLRLEAKILARENKLDEAIAKLQLYANKFRPRNDYYEDPYVYRELGDAHLARLEPGKTAPSSADMQAASDAYNTACYMMQERSRRDPSLEKLFWRWMLDFWTLGMRIADLTGGGNRYLDLQVFMQEYKDSDMGGLKSEFLKLEAHAKSKLPAAGAKTAPKKPEAAKKSGTTTGASKSKSAKK